MFETSFLDTLRLYANVAKIIGSVITNSTPIEWLIGGVLVFIGFYLYKIKPSMDEAKQQRMLLQRPWYFELDEWPQIRAQPFAELPAERINTSAPSTDPLVNGEWLFQACESERLGMPYPFRGG